MSDVAHDNWNKVKSIYRFHKFIIDGDISDLNVSTELLKTMVRQISYEGKTIIVYVDSYKER